MRGSPDKDKRTDVTVLFLVLRLLSSVILPIVPFALLVAYAYSLASLHIGLAQLVLTAYRL